MMDSIHPFFPSVTSALKYWRRWQEALRSGMAINPQLGDCDRGPSRREDILLTYMSVDQAVADTLTNEEKQAVDSMMNGRNQKPGQDLARAWHRAMTKLGKEMRQRGIVGQRERV